MALNGDSLLTNGGSTRLKQQPSYVEDSDSDDDVPLQLQLARRHAKPEPDSEASNSPMKRSVPNKSIIESDSSDDEPIQKTLSSRRKREANQSVSRIKKEDLSSDDEPIQKALSSKRKMEKLHSEPAVVPRVKKEPTSPAKNKKPELQKRKSEPIESSTPKKAKKEAQTVDVWKWWEEDRPNDGDKWKTLEHNGPCFAPDYEPLPADVNFYYDGKPVKLSADAEEIAGFYGKMLDHDYTSKVTFNRNFFKDWRSAMTQQERQLIVDFKLCDFREINDYFKKLSEERKNWTKEQKKALREENERLVEQYGYCIIDGHKQRIGNFKIEPPGLFRGRGEHPKMGKVKKRVLPEDVIINCGRGSKVPAAPAGHRWKEVRHDSTVTWLACWVENVQNQFKYVMLNAASKLKGEKDWQKYETARRLHQHVDRIRAQYSTDLKSKVMRERQRAVAIYLIDKLALRAGNEKDDDAADTVGCCSLRVEHIKLHPHLDGKDHVVELDFLGKDSIRYLNKVAVDKQVFKNIKLFMENKKPSDDLFDRLDTTSLNKYLREQMDGLTAKVFRTYNASKTLQEQLNALTVTDEDVTKKLLSYNRANREVARLCNHQRAVPKNFQQQMERIQEKMSAKEADVKAAKKEYKTAKNEYRNQRSDKNKKAYEQKKRKLERTEQALERLRVQATDRDEGKEIALGTSKLNYLDPRITVAWCRKNGVPVEKAYNKTQRAKFQWAIDMATADFNFLDMDSLRTKFGYDDEASSGEEDADEEYDEDSS